MAENQDNAREATSAGDAGPTFTNNGRANRRQTRVLDELNEAANADLRRESGNTSLLPPRYGMTLDPARGRTLMGTHRVPAAEPVRPIPEAIQTPVGQSANASAEGKRTDALGNIRLTDRSGLVVYVQWAADGRFRVVDSTGKQVRRDNICYITAYANADGLANKIALQTEADRLQDIVERARTREAEAYRQAMLGWRLSERHRQAAMVRAELQAGNYHLFVREFRVDDVDEALRQLDAFVADANAREGSTVENRGFPDGYSGRSIRTANFGLFTDDQLDALQHRYTYQVGMNIREDATSWANLQDRVRQEAQLIVRERTTAIRLDERTRADNATIDDAWAIRQTASMREEALIKVKMDRILQQAITEWIGHNRQNPNLQGLGIQGLAMSNRQLHNRKNGQAKKDRRRHKPKGRSISKSKAPPRRRRRNVIEDNEPELSSPTDEQIARAMARPQPEMDPRHPLSDKEGSTANDTAHAQTASTQATPTDDVTIQGVTYVGLPTITAIQDTAEWRNQVLARDRATVAQDTELGRTGFVADRRALGYSVLPEDTIRAVQRWQAERDARALTTQATEGVHQEAKPTKEVKASAENAVSAKATTGGSAATPIRVSKSPDVVLPLLPRRNGLTIIKDPRGLGFLGFHIGTDRDYVVPVNEDGTLAQPLITFTNTPQTAIEISPVLPAGTFPRPTVQTSATGTTIQVPPSTVTPPVTTTTGTLPADTSATQVHDLSSSTSTPMVTPREFQSPPSANRRERSLSDGTTARQRTEEVNTRTEQEMETTRSLITALQARLKQLGDKKDRPS